jgi:coenzyme F420-reducing hydrogenase gamma subunit
MQMYNRDGIPVVPVDSFIDLDPELSGYPDRAEVYRAIIKALTVRIDWSEPDPIGKAQARMTDCLAPFCREPGARERKDRIDRDTFKTDLKKDFEKTTGIKISEEPIEIGPEDLEDAKL